MAESTALEEHLAAASNEQIGKILEKVLIERPAIAPKLKSILKKAPPVVPTPVQVEWDSVLKGSDLSFYILDSQRHPCR